ncbi:unnamed protein product [Cuscuta campestris]|uniref:Uncharacterized protein n=1 Tax=Cuscuta campestris TaxID=132261 RepID=A0A484N2R3_9ASTE|nr:unnamed protein product [Cuscuta campestris]
MVTLVTLMDSWMASALERHSGVRLRRIFLHRFHEMKPGSIILKAPLKLFKLPLTHHEIAFWRSSRFEKLQRLGSARLNLLRLLGKGRQLLKIFHWKKRSLGICALCQINLVERSTGSFSSVALKARGLKPHLKAFVRALKPGTLAEAIDYGRCQEETVSTIKGQEKGIKSQFTSKGTLPTSVTKLVSSVPIATQPKFIPAAIRVEKIAKGLCYYCDKPFEKGHKCAGRGTSCLEVPGDLEIEEELDSQDSAYQVGSDNPLISVNAISGNQGFQTMRVTGLETLFSIVIVEVSSPATSDHPLPLAHHVRRHLLATAAERQRVADCRPTNPSPLHSGFAHTWEWQGRVPPPSIPFQVFNFKESLAKLRRVMAVDHRQGLWIGRLSPIWTQLIQFGLNWSNWIASGLIGSNWVWLG